MLYELYAAEKVTDGSWTAGSGAVFNLSDYQLRPTGWTSADAAGLAILPGLVRFDEVSNGEINHALRFTAPSTKKAYIWPARHYASSIIDPAYPPMGQRFRLKSSFNTSGYPYQAKIVLEALKKYGMILSDNGAPWYITGVPDERWNNDALHTLHQVKGSDFEAVDCTSLVINQDSGQARSTQIINGNSTRIGTFKDGVWHLDSNGNYIQEVSDKSISWGLPNDVPVVGDWNGDGKNGIGIFRPGSGLWSLDSNENFAWEPSDVSLSWGLPNDVPVVGDWNGDTKESIGIFRPSSGIWSLDSNENFAWEPSDVSLSWGLPNDVPVVGDWNGDTKESIGIFRPSSGIWSLDANENFAWAPSDVSLSWGLPNDVPVIGDWNGDTKESIGIFRPGSGIWSLDANENFAWAPSDVSLSWGLPNDVPVIGDWNGDTKESIGIFRPGSGVWSLDSNENLAWEPSDTSLSWGLPNDKPVVGKY